MGMGETTEKDEPPYEPRGIDGLMARYSRWRRRRLVTLAEMPLSALAVQTLYLCACVLADGVFLPWVVTVLQGEFSLLLFSALLIPLVAAEAVVYREMRVPRRVRP